LEFPDSKLPSAHSGNFLEKWLWSVYQWIIGESRDRGTLIGLSEKRYHAFLGQGNGAEIFRIARKSLAESGSTDTFGVLDPRMSSSHRLRLINGRRIIESPLIIKRY
jgi:hypothetical protein